MKTQDENCSSPLPTVQEEAHAEKVREDISSNAVKGGAWLLGIVGVFALCMLIVWMCNIDKSPLDRNLVSSEMALRQPAAAVKSSLKSVTATAQQPVAIVREVVVKPFAAVRKAANRTAATVRNTVSQPVAVKTASLTSTDNDRIEKEALEVIHGDYGNNPGRAARLGSDYAAVQARVNQLLHI